MKERKRSMPTLESVKQHEKSKACVEFALQKLEDVWNLEAALYSGATTFSEASLLMDSVRNMLENIHLVLVTAAPSPAPTSTPTPEPEPSVIDQWITAVGDVCIYTENVVLNFSNKAGRTMPLVLPEAVKRISPKPVDLFALNNFAIEMKKIQSQLRNFTNDVAFMYLTTNNHAVATLRPVLVPNIKETTLVGYEALQKRIIDKLLDPMIHQRLQVAILGPEGAGKTALAQKIYQSIVVKNHFDVCFWLFDINRFDYQRPQLFKPIDLLRKMFITLQPQNSLDDLDEEVVIERICGSLKLWIAEGMIPKDDGRTIQQTAELYLDQLIQRGFVRGIWAYYHNQPNQPILVVVIHPMLQSELFENNSPLIKVILGEEAVDILSYYGEADNNLEHLRRLALHSSYEYDKCSSFQEGKTLHGFKYPNLYSLFFFGSVAPLMYHEFNFLRVLMVFQARIRFCEEDKSCWLEGLINLRCLGFIVCWVEGGSLGRKLSRLMNLQTLDLSESFVSGISEFLELNTKVNVIGPIKEESQRFWSPVPQI